MVTIVIVIMWVFGAISLSVCTPIPPHKSVRILKAESVSVPATDRQGTSRHRGGGGEDAQRLTKAKECKDCVKMHPGNWLCVDVNSLNSQQMLSAAGKANKELCLHLLRIKG